MKHIAWGVGMGLVGIGALSLGSEEPPIDADAPQFAKLTNETAQLRARLAHVEEQLQQQQRQQQQVEAMLRQALDATASRLESLLGDSAAGANVTAPAAVAEGGGGAKALTPTETAAAQPQVAPRATPAGKLATTPAASSEAASSVAATGAPATSPAPAAPLASGAPRAEAARGPSAAAEAGSPAAKAAAVATPPMSSEAAATELSLGAPSLVAPQRRVWLWLLLGSGASALAILAWRWGRSPATELPPKTAASAADAGQLVVDAGTEALWATAHELGEPQHVVPAVTPSAGTRAAAADALPADQGDLPPSSAAVPSATARRAEPVPAVRGGTRIAATPAQQREPGAEPPSAQAPQAAVPLSQAPAPMPAGIPAPSGDAVSSGGLPWGDAVAGMSETGTPTEPSRSSAGAPQPSGNPTSKPAGSPARSPAGPSTDRPWSRLPAAEGPTRLHLVVPDAHPDARAAVELRLQIDPRVLKQPPPRVRVAQGMLEIDCALVPGLPPGDVAHVRAVLQQTAAQN